VSVCGTSVRLNEKAGIQPTARSSPPPPACLRSSSTASARRSPLFGGRVAGRQIELVPGQRIPMMKNHKAATTWRPSRYRPGEIEQALRAEPGVVGELLQRTGGAYEATTPLTLKFREDIREIAELISDDELLRIAKLPEVPVSLEHLRYVDPQTRIVVGYRLDVTPAESPRLRRRLALPPDPGITLQFYEVVFPGNSDRFWGAMHFDTNGHGRSGSKADSAA
jgi:hypothetical protein